MIPRPPTADDIVICGYPRSGSTMLYNMMRQGLDDFRTFDREVSAKGLREPGPRCTKHPSDRRYPELPCRRIITLRDPRDVLCSRHASQPKYYKVSGDVTIVGRPGHLLHTEGLVEADDQVRELDGLIVYFEDLIRAPSEVEQRIGDYLGIRFSVPFDDFHKYRIPKALAKQLNGIRAPDESRIGVWRRHPDRIREQFERFPELHDIVIRHGYAADRRWLEQL